ncbi:MAG: hypothetical protein H6Q10_1505, partial [Acidobacteria bacterium]|nr:hypothetical protein [Acidobacteriota bacterium]
LTLEEEEGVASALGRLLSPSGRAVEGEWVGLRFDRLRSALDRGAGL